MRITAFDLHGINDRSCFLMISAVRAWLIGIAAAALIAALADSLVPDGAAKKITKLAGGLVMLIAIIQPIMKFDFETMSGFLTGYRMQSEVSSSVLELENQRLIKIIIEEETAAYIQDKANEAGASCRVEVLCGANESGHIYPVFVTVYGNLTDKQQKDICRMIEGDLAVPAANQRFERTNEP